MAEDDQPSDTMRGRSARSDALLWLVLEADRSLVTIGLLLAVFLAILGIGSLHPNPGAVLETGDPVETLFQAFVTATITGVTLVLTLNQLVLSQELGSVGDQRERMEGAMSFRRDVESTLDAPVSPADPAAFLRALVEVTGDRAREVRAALDDPPERLGEQVDELVESIEGNAGQVSEGLEGEAFGEFAVVSAALNFNYSWKLYAARRIRRGYADDLGEEATGALDDLIETLRLFGPAREHFKTLYFQSDLIDLSRAILLAALPALVSSIAVLVYLDPANVPGGTLGVPHSVWLVALASTVALAPFVLLLAYVLRIATVTQRTLSIGPFILRETDRDEDLDWE